MSTAGDCFSCSAFTYCASQLFRVVDLTGCEGSDAWLSQFCPFMQQLANEKATEEYEKASDLEDKENEIDVFE